MKKMKILSRYNNVILFEYECEDNDIKKTMIKAIESDADLSGADLSGTNLSRADLSRANLSRANLSGADLSDADLKYTKSIRQIIPEQGSFIAWRKTKGYIIKLQIPTKIKRTCNIKSRKCRSAGVKTLQIQNADGTKAEIRKITHTNEAGATYEVGKMTYPDKYDDNFLEDCTNGIHFFISREEAVRY